ncbi:MAG: hypothetical protein ABIJ97_15920 [Bacteroidota bacterium]
MKKPHLILILLFFISAFRLLSQEEAENKSLLKYIGIEAGSVFYGSEFDNVDLIRKQNQYSYPADIYNNTVMNNLYLGAKAEFILTDYNLGILTGIRYSSLNSASGNNYSDENNDFFYTLYKDEETAVEYLRLRGVKHTASYIGIPIEIRYLIYKSKKIKFFGKASTDLQYQVSSKSDIFFLNEAMEIYEDDVVNIFNTPNDLLSTLYFSGGIKLGKDDDINLNLEVVFLSFILTENNSIMNNPLGGGGLQINIQMPF